MQSLGHNLRFVWWKSHAAFFRHLIFYILKHSVNCSCDIIISAWTLGRRHFWIYFKLYIIWSWNLVNLWVLSWRILFGNIWHNFASLLESLNNQLWLVSGFVLFRKYLQRPLKIINIINWLYVIIMSLTRFRVNLHSMVAWISKNSLLETGAIPEV